MTKINFTWTRFQVWSSNYCFDLWGTRYIIKSFKDLTQFEHLPGKLFNMRRDHGSLELEQLHGWSKDTSSSIQASDWSMPLNPAFSLINFIKSLCRSKVHWVSRDINENICLAIRIDKSLSSVKNMILNMLSFYWFWSQNLIIQYPT